MSATKEGACGRKGEPCQATKQRTPVLGEKPISNDLSKAREMVALAKEKNVRYGVNLNHRFTPAALKAKGWVEEGRLGELNIINYINRSSGNLITCL